MTVAGLDSGPVLEPTWSAVSFGRPFRRYQSLALDAFDRARSAQRTRFYLVMPPGAGKTVAGLEVARRLERRTLVLSPNTAVQSQWLRQWRAFEPDVVTATADRMLPSPLTVLTYHALCNLQRGGAIDERALVVWRSTHERERGLSPAQADAEIRALAASGTAQYRSELRRFRRHARRLILHGGRREELIALLHPNGRALLERMRAAGPWTLVLDECHHLLEMWGHLVRALADELGSDTFLIGLTATPPAEMAPREAALYRELFGQADFEVPTPAVVREGELAAYQELAWFTRPLPHEAGYVAAQHERFERLIEQLLGEDFGSQHFLDWVRRRVEERRNRDGAQLGWRRFERGHPRLAQAALRLLRYTRSELPAGARLSERHRTSLTADDWVVLIEDYCMRCLRPSADPRDAAAWDMIRAALPSLGYVLTLRGIRSHRSPVDRVLALSASKALAALGILEVEADALGNQLRALLLCDYEHASADGLRPLRGVLDPLAGSAALLLNVVASDPQARRLDPILMSGRTVACSRATAAQLVDWIEQRVPVLRGAMRLQELPSARTDTEAQGWDDIVALRPAHAWWRPRHYVPLVTHYFEEGRSRCLIGTRALLGEGWDAQRVNVLIDLTTAATRTSVHQMRGRSLRLDPALPRKVANNWDIVCIDPDHPKGAVDYARFVRKHHHYYAPTQDGEIESGVSHVHASLSPYAPPDAARMPAINEAMLERAQQRDVAYALWRIGEPYANRELHTARIRLERPLGLPGQRVLARMDTERNAAQPALYGRATLVAGSTFAAMSAGALFDAQLIGLAGAAILATAGTAWLLRWLRHGLRRIRPSDSLEDMAAAVADGLQQAGGIDPALGAAAVRVGVQSDGCYRCYLAGASEADSRLFAESLDELLAPLATPRYIIPRYVADPPGTLTATAAIALRMIGGRTGGRAVYHAVPAYLAANRKRVDAFHRAWNQHVSPGAPLYWKNSQAQGLIHVQQGERLFDVSTQIRVLWN